MNRYYKRQKTLLSVVGSLKDLETLETTDQAKHDVFNMLASFCEYSIRTNLPNTRKRSRSETPSDTESTRSCDSDSSFTDPSPSENGLNVSLPEDTHLVFTEEQDAWLHDRLKEMAYPTTQQLETMAKKLNRESHQIANWFCRNRRIVADKTPFRTLTNEEEAYLQNSYERNPELTNIAAGLHAKHLSQRGDNIFFNQIIDWWKRHASS